MSSILSSDLVCVENCLRFDAHSDRHSRHVQATIVKIFCSSPEFIDSLTCRINCQVF